MIYRRQRQIPAPAKHTITKPLATDVPAMMKILRIVGDDVTEREEILYAF